jgi:hypothetical protein
MIDAIDILYIVLAFSALWLTAFVCWLIWQVAMILKNVNDTMTEAREKISKIEVALTSMKERFESVSGSMSLLVEGGKKVIDYVVDKKKDKKEDRE